MPSALATADEQHPRHGGLPSQTNPARTAKRVTKLKFQSFRLNLHQTDATL